MVGLQLNDLGVLVTIVVAAIGIVWRVIVHINAESSKHVAANAELHKVFSASMEERNQRFENITAQFARVDKDIADVRLEFSTSLARLPSRSEIDHMLAQRMAPIEQGLAAMNNDVRSLTVELARTGTTIKRD